MPAGHNAAGVAGRSSQTLEVTLMQRRRTALVLFVPLMIIACADQPTPEVAPGQIESGLIYGADNRQDYYQVTDAIKLRVADATAAVVDAADLNAVGGGYALNVGTSFGAAYGLCSSEPYRTQPTTAFCTAFQVGPRLLATAGHCVTTSSCSSTWFVFGFRMDSATTVRSTAPASDVYRCSTVVGRAQTSTNDFAVVEVDRDIVGHTPLPIRRSGKVATGAALFVSGHPAGIPLKVAGGAAVKDNSQSNYFSANVDTYGGNSGSPVVDAATGVVEGILVRGNTDFVRQGSCYVSNVCSDNGCPGWEDATRTTNFVSYVPDVPVEPSCGTDADCDDGNGCNGAERCESGSCVAGAAVDCDDADACTSDSCVSAGGVASCQHGAVTCNDGDACTADSCDAVQGCAFEALVCGAGEYCSGGYCYATPTCQAKNAACGSNSDCCSDRCKRGRCR